MIPKIQNVLYTTDLSKNSAYAFRYAVNTARQHNAKIHILHVVEPLTPEANELIRKYFDEKKPDQSRKDEKKSAQRRIEERLKQARGRIEERLKQFAERELKDDPESLKRVVGIHVVQGDPATEILDKTDKLGCDTVIMGTHGKGALSRAFLGSVSTKVLRRILKPVYIIPIPKGKIDISFRDI